MLSATFEQQLRAKPDQTYSVVVTLQPDATESFLPSTAGLQPFEGLTGIYKGNLSGSEILTLQGEKAIQAIEPDDFDFHTLS